MNNLIVHLYSISSEFYIRISDITAPEQYFNEYLKIYGKHENGDYKIFFNNGKWIERLLNEIEFKKFKDFELKSKEPGMWLIDVKNKTLPTSKEYRYGSEAFKNDKPVYHTYTATSKEYGYGSGVFKNDNPIYHIFKGTPTDIIKNFFTEKFLHFIQNKIQEYNEEDDENDGKIDINMKIQEQLKNLPRDYHNLIEIKNFTDTFLHPEIPQDKSKEWIYYERVKAIISSFSLKNKIKINKDYMNIEDDTSNTPNDACYFISDMDLMLLIIHYFTNVFINKVIFNELMTKEYLGDLVITGKFNDNNDYITFNKTELTLDDMIYICQYFNILYIDSNILLSNIAITNEETLNTNPTGYKFNNKTLGFAPLDFNQWETPSNTFFIGHNDYLGSNEISYFGQIYNKTGNTLHNKEQNKSKYLYKNTYSNEIVYHDFEITYFNEFVKLKKIEGFKSSYGDLLLNSLPKNISSINREYFANIHDDIRQYDEIISILFGKECSLFAKYINIEKDNESNKESEKNNKCFEEDVFCSNAEKLTLQDYYTKKYVECFKNDNCETSANEVIKKVAGYLSYYMQSENINNNKIGKSLVDFKVKKVRKTTGYFYGITNPTSKEIENLQLLNRYFPAPI